MSNDSQALLIQTHNRGSPSLCYSVNVQMYDPDMEKDIFFLTNNVLSTTILPKELINFDKSEFATKQCIGKTRLPHIYRGKNYIIHFICYSFFTKI